MRSSEIKTVNYGSKFGILELWSLHECFMVLEVLFMLLLCHNSLAYLFRLGLTQMSAVEHKIQSNQDLLSQRQEKAYGITELTTAAHCIFFFPNFQQMHLLKAHSVYWPEWPNRCYFQVVSFGRHGKVHLFSLSYDKEWNPYEDISEECLV